MPMLPGHRLLSVLIGLCAGSLSGLMGVGGGLVMVPGMVLAMNFPQHLANGTSLAAIFLTVIPALYEYTRSGFVDWNLAVLLAVGSVCGAVFGSILSHKFPSATLRKLFGVFLIGVAAWLFYSPNSQQHPTAPHLFGGVGSANYVIVLVLGGVAGTIAGFFGVGGGLIMVPMMTLILGLTQRTAQGVSLAVIIPTAFSGWMIHRKRGNVNTGVALYMAGSAMLFGWLVARIATGMDDHLLKQIFSGIVVITAVNLLFRKDVT